jgi:KDO2-lipid IV(A) lauroyltransferase
LPEQFLKNGRNVLFVGGHYNNWELYGLALPLSTEFDAYAAYTPLTNRFLNKKTKESRSKFGLKMVTPRELKDILTQKNQKPFQIVFAADQSPAGNQKCHWMKFLNRNTAVLTGVERLAKQQNMVVIYGTIQKVKRGHYTLRYNLVTDTPKETQEGEITEIHTRMLEMAILKQPQYWLWSHKRWKKTKTE